jgi:GWxTD domain-containing protein
VNSRRIFFAMLLVSMVVTAAAVAQGSRQAPTGDAYQKWVEEDVVYIITPEERSAFESLKTNDERDHFIVQFWLRRDPTPDTAENEFKEEHYRRIAYSNEHFAGTLPGWKTDRGRIYIVDGPPDEKQYVAPATQDELGHRAEVWKYRDGREFRFVDTCDCGEYRLVMPSHP